MAVYKHSYTSYSGALTPRWSRFLVLYRCSKKSLFRSKFQTGFFVLCFFYPLLCLLAIYLANNLTFLAEHNAISAQFLRIDNVFFLYFVNVQGVLAFILSVFVGPGLISPDLAHGALPLYFCRPFSRAEYILGKVSVLAILLSEITWIPGLTLLALEALIAGPQWASGNLWMAGSMMLSFWIWIAILSLLAMALSAWVKWKLVAQALLLAVFFMGIGLSQAINVVLRTQLGYLINVVYLMNTLQYRLFRIGTKLSLSWAAAWIALLVYCLLCLVLLIRKVRAYEVIK